MTEASPGKLTRQQIYDRIRESSKDEYILSEMKRLGFWPKNDEKPSAAEETINRQAELQKELRALWQRKSMIDDPEAALKAMRKERMLESRKRQEENRQRKNQERFEKATAWHEQQRTQIRYLGEGVSASLHYTDANEDKLTNGNLPILRTAGDLAEAMGISVRELRFLSYSRKVSKVSHYRQFEISKKTGGVRQISAPMPRLKRAQYWILENLFNRVELHDSAHGFIAGRSIVSNAQAHVGAKVVINMDLKDFFPTISYRRVKGLVQSLGYSEQVSAVVGLLATESNTDMVELHGERYFVANGERRLPQGSPASPAISNVICRRLDRRLHDMAKKLGYVYTRYADDMSFSTTDQKQARETSRLLWRARSIVTDEGFAVHPDKTRIMRQGARQEVTGIVVNDKTSLDRKTVRRFRAALHRLETSGVDAVEWNGSDNVLESMAGYANYLAMVDPEKGGEFRHRIAKCRQQDQTHSMPTQFSKARFRQAAVRGEAPRDAWWQPAEPQAPVLEKTQQQIKDEKREKRRAEQPSQATVEPSTVEQTDSPDNYIDPATGRFRPTWTRLLWIMAAFVVIAIITRNPQLLITGGCWIFVSRIAWRAHIVGRLLMTFGLMMAVSLVIISFTNSW